MRPRLLIRILSENETFSERPPRFTRRRVSQESNAPLALEKSDTVWFFMDSNVASSFSRRLQGDFRPPRPSALHQNGGSLPGDLRVTRPYLRQNVQLLDYHITFSAFVNGKVEGFVPFSGYGGRPGFAGWGCGPNFSLDCAKTAPAGASLRAAWEVRGATAEGDAGQIGFVARYTEAVRRGPQTETFSKTGPAPSAGSYLNCPMSPVGTPRICPNPPKAGFGHIAPFFSHRARQLFFGRNPKKSAGCR